MHPLRGSRKSGFTLIEAIAASLMATFLMAGVYGVFRVAQRSIAEAEDSSDLSQIARAVLTEMTRELNNCYPLANPNDDSATPQVWFVFTDQEDPATHLPVDALEFVTLTGPGSDLSPISQPHADIIGVRYLVHISGTERTPSPPSTEEVEEGLVKFVDYYPGLRSSSYQPEPTLTVPEVRSLNFRFRDGTSEEWLDDWDSAKGLPAAVEVTVGIFAPQRTKTGNIIFFTAAVDLPMFRTPLQAVAEEIEMISRQQEQRRAESPGER